MHKHKHVEVQMMYQGQHSQDFHIEKHCSPSSTTVYGIENHSMCVLWNAQAPIRSSSDDAPKRHFEEIRANKSLFHLVPRHCPEDTTVQCSSYRMISRDTVKLASSTKVNTRQILALIKALHTHNRNTIWNRNGNCMSQSPCTA